MMHGLMGNKHPNISFNILFYPQYQNDDGQVVCHPGSVFEGVVQIKVTEPMPVHHIKLVFKASERVNYDAMGWEKTKNSDDRLFAVRTVLWGLPTGINIPVDAWPVLDVGEHNFPFVCQMPVINFPPTFQHHLIATAFQLIVSVTKGGESLPILSKPATVCFQPIIETIPVKNLYAFTEETKVSSHISAVVTVPRLAYNINDKNQSISVVVQFQSVSNSQDNVSVSQLRVQIKRYYSINYKTFSRNETTVIAQHDHPRVTSAGTVSINLDLPNSPDELPSTLTYSPHLTVEYKLVVTAKVRHGLMSFRKRLFEMPVIFGTLPAGTKAPRQLEPYSNIVDNRSIMHSKPAFLRPEPKAEDDSEFLPAYGDDRPPAYNNNASSSMRIVEITS
ncbi:hypothetical protein INT47_008112 [Mucor saturninus]|uniref:Arrestin C-terminal-like domain-containing protein n=1 Tax=Mucor saturninus TaxID=64648 RepID=A0A8H7R240_9FUNG|nr:hypothetical protein INT47_008112 [Mucor saturninus]